MGYSNITPRSMGVPVKEFSPLVPWMGGFVRLELGLTVSDAWTPPDSRAS